MELYPNINFIKRQHLGLSDELLQRAEEGNLPDAIIKAIKEHPDYADYSEAEDVIIEESETNAEPPAMPLEIRELIRQKVKLAQAKFSKAPKAGQIICIDSLPEDYEQQLQAVMTTPLYVLLDEADELAGKDIWYGWVCSGETQYASWFDFILQEEDEPFEPAAGMVQLWNPVHLPLSLIKTGTVKAELAGERLSAIRALAAELIGGKEPENAKPLPGRVLVRQLGQHTLVTGTPLGDNEQDPRYQYQSIYIQAADAIREATRLYKQQLAQKLSLFEKFKQLWQKIQILPEIQPEPLAVAMADENDSTSIEPLRIKSPRARLVALHDSKELRIINESDDDITLNLYREDHILTNSLTIAPGEESILEMFNPDTAFLELCQDNQCCDKIPLTLD